MRSEGQLLSITFFRVLMPRWETALLPWDLLCFPVRIAWEEDIYIHTQIFRLLDRIGPVGRFGEKVIVEST